VLKQYKIASWIGLVERTVSVVINVCEETRHAPEMLDAAVALRV
jgi:hypothetical protein